MFLAKSTRIAIVFDLARAIAGRWLVRNNERFPLPPSLPPSLPSAIITQIASRAGFIAGSFSFSSFFFFFFFFLLSSYGSCFRRSPDLADLVTRLKIGASREPGTLWSRFSRCALIYTIRSMAIGAISATATFPGLACDTTAMTVFTRLPLTYYLDLLLALVLQHDVLHFEIPATETRAYSR